MLIEAWELKSEIAMTYKPLHGRRINIVEYTIQYKIGDQYHNSKVELPGAAEVLSSPFMVYVNPENLNQAKLYRQIGSAVKFPNRIEYKLFALLFIFGIAISFSLVVFWFILKIIFNIQ